MLKGAFILGLLVSVVILLVIFVALRGFMLWYWKVNDVIAKLDLILTELKNHSEKP
jgi:hypothetical protein